MQSGRAGRAEVAVLAAVESAVNRLRGKGLLGGAMVAVQTRSRAWQAELRALRFRHPGSRLRVDLLPVPPRIVDLGRQDRRRAR